MPAVEDEETFGLIADRFKVLSEPMRLRILRYLCDSGHAVGEIVEALDAGQANVSKHLSILYDAGLVTRKREGTSVIYSIADPTVFELCDVVCGSIGKQLAERQRALGPLARVGGGA